MPLKLSKYLYKNMFYNYAERLIGFSLNCCTREWNSCDSRQPIVENIWYWTWGYFVPPMHKRLKFFGCTTGPLKWRLHRCPLIVVAICNAIAEGLMHPWMPAAGSAHKLPSTTELAPSPTDKSRKRAAGKPRDTSFIKQVKSKASIFSFSPDALPHLKAAVEVLQF